MAQFVFKNQYIFYDDEMPEEWYNMREINILKLAEKKLFLDILERLT